MTPLEAAAAFPSLPPKEAMRLARLLADHDGRITSCPQCGAEHLYHGEALEYCACGYCRHAVLTSGTCDHCGEREPEFVEMTPAHHAVKE